MRNFFLQISNISVNMKKDLYLSSKRSQQFTCQKAVLGNKAFPLFEHCTIKPRVVNLIETALRFDDSYSLMIEGPGVLHYSCNGQPASMIALEKQITLFLVHNSCNLHGVFENSVQYHFPATTQIGGNFTVFPLLKYVLPNLATRAEKIDLILWSLGVTVIIIACLLLILALGCLYAKRRLGMRIRRNTDRNLELQLRCDSLSPTNSHRSSSIAMPGMDLTLERNSTPIFNTGRKVTERKNLKSSDLYKESLQQGIDFQLNEIPKDTLYNQMWRSKEQEFLNDTFPNFQQEIQSKRMSLRTTDSGISHTCKSPECLQCLKMDLPIDNYKLPEIPLHFSNTIVRKIAKK